MTARAHRAYGCGVLLLLFALPVAAGSAAEEEHETARRLFSESAGELQACAVCHKLADAGATGEIGPDLDQLKPDEARVSAAVRDGVGVMPSFRDTLTDEEIDALARYVTWAVQQ